MAISKPIPGQRSGVSITPRDVLMSSQVIYGRGTIDAANAYDGANTGKETEIRAGTIMARITASNLWVPCKRTQVNMTGATTTSVVVDDARAFKVGEVVTIGANTSITISAINYATNTLTVSSITVVDNTAVFCTSLAGSDIARGVLNEFVMLKEEDGVARNQQFGNLILFGMVNAGQILNSMAEIRAASGMFLNGIIWSDQVGQS
ncbi:MAG: hypothetical protein NT069_22110 [Planctomycetota bacterium]|nr:hypothetical protein [Planctomycetota bacterium]